MIEIEHLVWEGGYKDYFDDAENYWLRNQLCEQSTRDVLQRFYSGATAGISIMHNSVQYYIRPLSVIICQKDGYIYIGRNFSSPPIENSAESYPKYNLLDNTARDAILDLLPESWLMYMKNEQGYDCTKYVYQYNHDDLVADGIEQS